MAVRICFCLLLVREGKRLFPSGLKWIPSLFHFTSSGSKTDGSLMAHWWLSYLMMAHYQVCADSLGFYLLCWSAETIWIGFCWNGRTSWKEV